ncbi:MAG: ProQ/FinO family protein [Caldimonas sp.]
MSDPDQNPDLDPEAPVDTTSAATTVVPADTGVRLRTLFPALFGSRAKPIKLQIQQDIQQRAPGAFSRRELSAFFSRHTRSTPYLIAVSRATERFGLDGEPSGALSDEHRNAALQELARRRANRQEREALADQQRRNRATLLRDFEHTTLTAANFCALKGVDVDALEGLLTIARQEAQERQPDPAARGHRPAPPGRRRPG